MKGVSLHPHWRSVGSRDGSAVGSRPAATPTGSLHGPLSESGERGRHGRMQGGLAGFGAGGEHGSGKATGLCSGARLVARLVPWGPMFNVMTLL